VGMSGLSNDMRTLRAAIKDGDRKARLAVDKFTWTIARWIGSFMAELGGLDMLVFTGGIGENDMDTRAEICSGLAGLGIVVDPARNNGRGAALISAEGSPVTVRVVPPAEDLVIVNHVVRMLGDEPNALAEEMQAVAASV
jgi:acetate kinase